MRRDALVLSPSVLHRRLLARTAPALAYRGGNVRAWQRKLRARLRELLGIGAEKRVPLNVRSLWKQQVAQGSVEKIVFAAEPFADVPAYVCLPKNARPPYTFFICLQGHTGGMHVSIGRQSDESGPLESGEADRDFAVGCMSRGIAALCIEQRSMGLRREQAQERRSNNGCLDATMAGLMLGRTLIGQRVFDVDRGIDYLESRGDADMSRLGVLGNSAGGAVCAFAAAIWPRVRLAMPSCYFCTFAEGLMFIPHCPDNYVPRLLQYAEMADVMGLFAPRPVVIVAGAKDTIFPIRGVRKAFRRLKQIYRAAGVADRCRLVVGPEGHRFYADLGWKAMLKELNAP